MDRMMASPLTTTLGGTCCRPRALRNRLNTTTILVNEVTITATKGASARPTTVTRMTPGLRLPKSIDIEREQLHPEPPAPAPGPRARRHPRECRWPGLPPAASPDCLPARTRNRASGPRAHRAATRD